jgi:guanylate kinase
MNKKGLLVILSAPSGCGKDTVFRELCKIRDDVVESVSATTRKPRDGEVDGINYYFKSENEFKQLISNNGLLEYTVYNSCYYGTPVEGVEHAIQNGKICFLIIEVQGAQHIMRMRPDCVSIFLLPPSLEVLEQRLRKRETNDEEDVKRRMELAKYEVDLAPLYKYNIVNDVLEDAVEKINQILNNELDARNI